MITLSFLNQQGATRAVNSLNFVDFEGMRLRVKYAHRAYNHGDVDYSPPPKETRMEKPEQRDAINWTKNSGSSETKERKAIDPSQGRRRGKPSKPSPAAKANPLSRSDRNRSEAPETPTPISRSISQHGHKQYLPGVQNGNGAADPPEVIESTESSTTGAQEVNVATSSPEILENPGDSSTINQGVNADVPEQRTEPEQGTIVVAGPPALDVGIKDHSRTLPETLSRIDEISATEPHANQDTNLSSSSLVSMDTSAAQPLDDSKVPPRLTHRCRWKLTQRATKAAKQKKIAERNEHLDSGAMSQGLDLPTQTTVESIALCIEPKPVSIINPSVSRTYPRDTAEQHVKMGPNMHPESSSIEKSSAAFVGHIEGELRFPLATNSEATADMSQAVPTRHLDNPVASLSVEESSNVLQEQVPLTPKTTEAPGIISKSVNETLITELPSLSEQAKTGVAEGLPSPSTPITTHKKKKRKTLTPETDDGEKPSDTPPSEGSPATPEPHPWVTEKPTDNKVLLVQVDATYSTGSRDGTLKPMKDEEELDRINEPSTSPRGESATPTPNHPSSRAAQPTKMKSKRSRKSKGKKKTKSAKGSSQTSTVQSEELQGSSVSYVRDLPEPETPFLVGNVDTIPPSIPEKKEKDYRNTTGPSAREEPSICSRTELKQYHHLKDSEYWPAMYKAMQAFFTPDPDFPTVPIPEESPDVEHMALSRSQSTASGEAESSASEKNSRKAKRTSISETADDEFNLVRPEVVAQAEEILQTCAKRTDSGSSTVAEPEKDKSESVSLYQVSATGAPDSPLSDPKVAAESSPCESNWHRRSRTRPHTPQTLYTPPCTDSLSSLETLTDDESSESSNLQSGDSSMVQGGEEYAAIDAENSLYFASRMPITTNYPCHPAAVPLQPKGPSTLQSGDAVEVANDDGGNRETMKSVQDGQLMRITDMIGKERDAVERRDPSVVAPKEVWGYPESVWTD